MIESLYTKYFQKSRSFLFPALGIKRTSNYTPSGTYLSIEGLIGPEDVKLICSFPDDQSEGFKAFEQQMLLSNPLFLEVIDIQGYKLYVFDFDIYKNDWYTFLLGKYSKLSTVLKRAIKNYYGDKSSEYRYIETFLFPDKYFTIYAKLLDVDVKTLEETGELCDPCDLEKETLKIPVEDLELLKKGT
jgi:hypothetical protein